MHSATQLIAQRAPPAIRTKPRWQPYHSIAQSNTLALRSPTVAFHNTPSSIVPPSQDLCPLELSVKETTYPAPIPPTPIAQTPKDASQRDASKHKFAAGLIDQAVNILTEIWRPQDVPDVFKAPSKGLSIGSALGHALPLTSHQSMPVIATHPPTPIAAMMANQQSHFPASTSHPSGTPENNLLPMKTFVHEVLKRSRTSGSILQAALCYLEAIRPKVPEILQQEKMGIRAHYQPETKILPATEAELAREAELELADIENTFDIESMDQEPIDEMKTVRVTDVEAGDFDSMQQVHEDSASISSLIAEPPTPVNVSSNATRSSSLPSPLLCPRRAFLASLILASKFFQDKCYSNRAWAKLSGLPPREIGRCERALGQALEWRLWVGKSAIQTQSSSPPSTRNIIRSQSESSIIPSSMISTSASLPPVGKPLRKCSTLPTEIFSTLNAPAVSVTCHSAAINIDQGEVSKSDVPLVAVSAPSLDSDPSQPQYAEKLSSTPSPDTPGLTYSPSSSTDSSAGDCTIQMSTFEEGMFPVFNSSQPWIDVTSTAPLDVTSFGFRGNNMMSGAQFASGFEALQKKPQSRRIAIIGTDLGTFGSLHAGNCLWHAGNRCISLETTDVH